MSNFLTFPAGWPAQELQLISILTFHHQKLTHCRSHLDHCGSWDLQKFAFFCHWRQGGVAQTPQQACYLINIVYCRENSFVNLDCICISGFWVFALRPPLGLCCCISLGDLCPSHTLCQPTSKSCLHYWQCPTLWSSKSIWNWYQVSSSQFRQWGINQYPTIYVQNVKILHVLLIRAA